MNVLMERAQEFVCWSIVDDNEREIKFTKVKRVVKFVLKGNNKKHYYSLGFLSVCVMCLCVLFLSSVRFVGLHGHPIPKKLFHFLVLSAWKEFGTTKTVTFGYCYCYCSFGLPSVLSFRSSHWLCSLNGNEVVVPIVFCSPKQCI